MTTPSIDGTARSVVTPFMESTHPSGLTTTSAAIMKRMAPEKLEKANSAIISAIRSNFGSDAFSADIAEFSYRQCYDETRVDIFSAILTNDSDAFGEQIRKIAESEENLAEIQAGDDFNISIRPLHDEFEKHYLDGKIVKDRLKSALNIDVLPVASGESWVKAVSFISRLPKTPKEIRETLALFDITNVSDDSMQCIMSTRDTVLDLLKQDLLKDVINNVAHTIGKGPEDRQVAAITGSLDERVLWQEITTRLEAVTSSAVTLTDYRRANEIASTTSALVDFSMEMRSIVPAAKKFVSGMSDESTLGTLTAFGVDLSEYGISEEIDSRHLAALVAHILMYAGASIDLVDRSSTSSQGLDRPRSTVPLSWNVMYPLLSRRLQDLWRCFLPKAQKLEFYEKLSAYASRKAATPIPVDKTKPELIQALRRDIARIVTDVRMLASEGVNLDVNELLLKAKLNIVRYSDELVTPFDDQNITVISSVNSFVSHPVLVGTAIRALGVVAHPANNGKGFAEAAIGKNLSRFNAITNSITMKEVGELYNRISDFTTVSANAINIPLDIFDSLGAALHDAVRNLERVPHAKVKTTLASEMITDAKFENLGKDFYAIVEQSNEQPLLLASGGAMVKVNLRSVGNLHSTFAYGVAEPKSPMSLSAPFDQCVVSAMKGVLDLIVDAYAPTCVEIQHKIAASVDLTETNDHYGKRISRLADSFEPYEGINANLLFTMAGTPLLVEGMGKLLNPEMVRFARSIDSFVRPDAHGIIKLSAKKHAEVLCNSYAEESISLFIRSITTVLNEQDRMAMMHPSYRNMVKSLGSNVEQALEPAGDMLRVIYLMELFSALKNRLATDILPDTLVGEAEAE